MINGVSSVATALKAAIAEFDRAAMGTVSAAQSSGDDSAGGGDVVGSMAEMDKARFALLASLAAARASNEALDEVLTVGEYRTLEDAAAA